jgi:apolipoprotein D and lipocalin family protein
MSRLPELKTVPAVDLNKYLGLWYEIAAIPTAFEKDCVGVTATYTMRPDGKIRVFNHCWKKTLDGQEAKIEGRAWLPDPKDTAKLKVSFFLWFAADYWIIELGKEYEYAVVGNPGRDYLWILSRAPQMNETLYQALLQRIAGHGYDVQRLHKTLQAVPVIPEKKHLYKINDQLVTEKEYRQLADTLKGQEHWSCAETNEGGITSWESKDAQGRRYRVATESASGGGTSSISKTPE